MFILHVAGDNHPIAAMVPEGVGQISKRLAPRGHEVHVATIWPPWSWARGLSTGSYVHRFKVEGGGTLMPRGDIDGYLDFVRSRPWNVIVMHCARVWLTDMLLPHVGELKSAVIFVGDGLLALDQPAHAAYWSWFAASLQCVDAGTSLSPLF